MEFSSAISILSLLVSSTVVWLTIFRRGSLYMTQPVLIAFVFENGKPKVFLRTLLYATGKRGYVIEGLYLKIERANVSYMLGFWGYGEANNLMPASGLRIGEDGAVYNHHFLEISENGTFQFLSGEYEISVYARIVNRSSPRLLYKTNVTLSADDATRMADKNRGVLFTWNPGTKQYYPSVSERGARPD